MPSTKHSCCRRHHPHMSPESTIPTSAGAPILCACYGQYRYRVRFLLPVPPGSIYDSQPARSASVMVGSLHFAGSLVKPCFKKSFGPAVPAPGGSPAGLLHLALAFLLPFGRLFGVLLRLEPSTVKSRPRLRQLGAPKKRRSERPSKSTAGRPRARRPSHRETRRCCGPGTVPGEDTRPPPPPRLIWVFCSHFHIYTTTPRHAGLCTRDVWSFYVVAAFLPLGKCRRPFRRTAFHPRLEGPRTVL